MSAMTRSWRNSARSASLPSSASSAAQSTAWPSASVAARSVSPRSVRMRESALIVAQVRRPPRPTRRHMGVDLRVPFPRCRLRRQGTVALAGVMACAIVIGPAEVPTPAHAAGQVTAAPLPEAAQLIRDVKAGLRTDEDLLRQYTFRERRRDVDVTKFGKVRFGPWREFEVYPSEVPGET